MSDEGFLKRWSRKKRTEPPATEKESAELPPSNPSAGSRQVLPPQTAEGSSSALPPPAAAPNEEEAIDPATLPSIESLGPESDYTVFLKKGVPEALRLAALRKAWMSDPFIRDFRSPAIDYGWDFTTPEYSLRAGDDVGKMLEKIFPPATAEGPKPEAAPSSAEPASPEAPRSGALAPETLRLPQKQAVEPTPPDTAEPAPAQPEMPRRKHGGALPG